jgi:hypothetical protein
MIVHMPLHLSAGSWGLAIVPDHNHREKAVNSSKQPARNHSSRTLHASIVAICFRQLQQPILEQIGISAQ